MERTKENLKGAQFEVKLRVATNEKTGEEFLLRTDEELEEDKLISIRRVHDDAAMRAATGAKQEFVEALVKGNLAGVESRYAHLVEDRDAVIAGAQLHTFNLIKPTYGEHLEAEDFATTINHLNEQVTDNNKYAGFLFPRAIVGKTPDEVRAIESPLIGRELRAQFMRSLFPNQERLLFTSSPSRAT